ncbi:hypothetical protein [Microbacterium rhizosphaerae]|uniref:YggT family protein n=1 Tax=Microbacterium rhizosphaerae TaxID=1678237 RepID=A0ABZ0SRP4_9MICO|nr:hypothetical protein [Microbacterium rhizosphaerae]WPR91348.1 hypothetical protein SM116_08750 [Microbacterium rhizosphaerae]
MDILFSYLHDILPVMAIILVAAFLSRLVFLLAIALAFAPGYERRMLKLLEVSAPLVRKSGVIGTRRIHERIAAPVLMVLAMFHTTAKTARRILAILKN